MKRRKRILDNIQNDDSECGILALIVETLLNVRYITRAPDNTTDIQATTPDLQKVVKEYEEWVRELKKRGTGTENNP